MTVLLKTLEISFPPRLNPRAESLDVRCEERNTLTWPSATDHMFQHLVMKIKIRLNLCPFDARKRNLQLGGKFKNESLLG